MSLLQSLIPWSSSHSDENNDDDDGYDVCRRAGHDYREYEPNGMEAKYLSYKKMIYRPGQKIVEDINVEIIPGQILGFQYLQSHEIAYCRDCPHSKTSTETVEKDIIIKEDGDIRSLTMEDYETMAEKVKEEQEEKEG